MSKPTGVTWDMRTIQANATENAIWDAVEAAIDAGWTVEQFRREAAGAWREKKRRDIESDDRAWEHRRP
jgi:hypothetical protein